MKALRVKGNLSVEELKKCYLGSKDKRERMRWQGLWLIKDGMNAPAVAKIVCRGVQSVRKWIQWYNNDGVDRIKARPNKGNTARLTEEQFNSIEEWLNSPFQNGGRWTGKILRQKILEDFKIDYSLDGIYYILHRRMYGLKRPRPHHPKINKQAQEDFKKGVWTKDYNDSEKVSWADTKDIF